MILLLDNYDSFTYNISQCLEQLDFNVLVKKNDDLTLAEISKLKPKAIVLGPGPGTPDKAGITLDCIKYFAGRMPILGICLGHQAIAQSYGAKINHAAHIMHGHTSKIYHDELGVFKGIDNPTEFTRYHSLIVESSTLPSDFIISAWTDARHIKYEQNFKELKSRQRFKELTCFGHLNSQMENEIMGIRHKELALEGVQFHPESILSTSGLKLFDNFLNEYNVY